MDAIKHAEILDKRAKGVADECINEVWGSGYGIFSGEEVSQANVRFSPKRSRWISSEHWHTNQQAKINKDGSFELRGP